MSDKAIIVRQVRSEIGRLASHKACLRGLGIHRMHQVIRVPATAENLGMVKKIAYMLKVEEI